MSESGPSTWPMWSNNLPPMLCAQLEEAAVYRLYTARGELLYVGCTGNLNARLRAHSYQTSWWSEVVAIEFDAPLGKSLARQLERVQIRRLAPLHNRVANYRRGWDYRRGAGAGAVVYFPSKDEFREPAAA